VVPDEGRVAEFFDESITGEKASSILEHGTLQIHLRMRGSTIVNHAAQLDDTGLCSPKRLMG
jgi:hypothetical protein